MNVFSCAAELTHILYILSLFLCMHAMDEWQFPDAGERSARHGKRKREIYVPHPNTPVSHSTITTSPNSQGCIGVIRNRFLYPNWWTSCTTHGYPMGHREKVHVRGSLRSLLPFQSRLCVCLLTCRYRIVYCVCNFAYQIMMVVIWKSFDFDLFCSTLQCTHSHTSRVVFVWIFRARPSLRDGTKSRSMRISRRIRRRPFPPLARCQARFLGFFCISEFTHTYTHTHTRISRSHTYTLSLSHICIFAFACTCVCVRGNLEKSASTPRAHELDRR